MEYYVTMKEKVADKAPFSFSQVRIFIVSKEDYVK